MIPLFRCSRQDFIETEELMVKFFTGLFLFGAASCSALSGEKSGTALFSPEPAGKVAVSAEQSSMPETPLVIQDTGKNRKEDFAGNWVAYRMYYSYPSGKLDTGFTLTADGCWLSRSGESQPRKLGTFRVTDDYILFQPSVPDGKKTNDRAIPGRLLNKNGFVLTGHEQKNRSVMYRREQSISSVSLKELEGKWQFFDVDPLTRKKRPSPFIMEFKPDGTYEVHLKRQDFIVPQGAGKGVYELKKDSVNLKNACKTDGPWKNMSFFMLFDNLILNQPDGGYVFGEKQ